MYLVYISDSLRMFVSFLSCTRETVPVAAVSMKVKVERLAIDGTDKWRIRRVRVCVCSCACLSFVKPDSNNALLRGWLISLQTALNRIFFVLIIINK